MGINSINIQESTLTGFEHLTGFNGISVAPIEKETYFELLKGFNGASVELSRETYFALQKGFNSVSVENENISNWTLINELGEQVFYDGTLTVTNGLESYSVPVVGGIFTLYPYLDDITLLPVFQRVQFVSAVSSESGYVDLVPTAGEYVLRLYVDMERENYNITSFGSWNRAIQHSEILHLHNNGMYNNPWIILPVYHDRLMHKDMENWIQFQDGSFYDDLGTLKVINYGSGDDAIVEGFSDLNEISKNILDL